MKLKCFLLVACIALPGCYGYKPLATPQPAVGTPVAVTLNDEGTAELYRLIGSGADVVDGRVLKTNDSALTVGIRMVRLRNGQENYWRGEDITIAQRQIAGLSERRFDRRRTVLAFSTAIVGVIIAGKKFSKTGGGDLPPVGGKPPIQ